MGEVQWQYRHVDTAVSEYSECERHQVVGVVIQRVRGKHGDDWTREAEVRLDARSRRGEVRGGVEMRTTGDGCDESECQLVRMVNDDVDGRSKSTRPHVDRAGTPGCELWVRYDECEMIGLG